VADTVNLIRIRPSDNVGVAVRAIKAGDAVRIAQGFSVPAREDVPYGHKVALERIGAGQPILKYGECVGHASREIEPGEVVHTHNVEPLPMPDVLVDAT